MTLQFTESAQMQDIIRMFNTNVDGRAKIIKALTGIRGLGFRIATLICKKAGIDTTLCAGQVDEAKLAKVGEILEDPLKYGIPMWFLNRQRDPITGKSTQNISTKIEADFRLYLERAKKIKYIKGLRVAAGLKANGQRTHANGRGGKTVGVSRKK